ncbi:MAG: carbamoyltransferase [Rickettsiales bacterium]|jgi:carbamoyltransferase|nr:carbamoyltransferase [Rickettsiales bacterium]
MIILGIHDGHNASAALIVDGKLICAIGEERLSRDKHQYGYPAKAIETVLKFGNISPSDIDRVAMATPTLPPAYFYTQRNSTFSINDYWKEQREYWYPKLFENKNPKYLDIFSHKVNKDNFPYDESLIKDEKDHEGMLQARIKHLTETLNISKEIVSVHDHHESHAYYGYISSPYRNDNSLVYTMDGGGDNANGTVSIGEAGEPLNEISRSSNCNIGRMYRYATLLLGMRPADHEYKLMGLAAYNSEKYGKNAYDVYAETLQVDGLGFKYKNQIKDHFWYFKEKLEGQRFDAVAYGIQKRCEVLLTEWVSNGIKETGIGNIVMSGGVAQNIKANKLIAELDGVNQVFIPPGPGDESISIGAAFLELVKNGMQVSDINSPSDGYFGPSHSEDSVKQAIDKHAKPDWNVRKVKPSDVAELIANGDVVSRFGLESMEFGARALGNRSIIADPRRPDVIHHINKLVKMRDFWMPFAPSILAERENDYMINPKGIDGRFMAVGFDSTELAKEHLPAGLHPFDRSARPQIVHKEDNPSYHALIKAFEDLTGVGALMNTSFNIHGEPIVGTPDDAFDTFARCGLHHLLIGEWLISKPA